MTIPAGSAISDGFTVSVNINKWKSFNSGRQYVIPVRLNHSDDIGIISGQDVALLQLTVVIESNAVQIEPSYAPNSYGSGNGFNIPKSTFIDPATGAGYTNFTVEGRFKFDGIFDGDGSGGRWFNDLFSGSTVFFSVTSSGSLPPISGPVASLIQIQLHQWYNFSLVFSGNNVTYFINGKKYTTLSLSSPTPSYVNFGTTTGTAEMQVAEYRVWKTARTAPQINAFKCAADPTDPDLVGYWPLNTTDPIDMLKDISGHGNNLTADESSTFTLVPGVKCPD
ncbi:MAG: hypothetical protein QM764_17360 [Chitinophagaceae bacterium]